MGIPIIPISRILSWLQNGTADPVDKFVPQDDTLDAINVVLNTGLSSKHLAANAIDSAQITNLSVTAAKLATDAVETAKIKNGNVTAIKLASDSVETIKILNLNVTTAKLAANAVTGAKMSSAFMRLITSFAGVDGSGVEPDLGCTLTGAVVGDKVIGVIDFATGGTGAALFESTISVVDEIQQTSLTDLSTKTYTVFLLAQS